MLLDRILPVVLLTCSVTSAWSAVAFERTAFDMPMRCDMAVAVDGDADGDLDLIGICRTKLMGVRLPEGEVVELFDAEDGSMIHGVAVDMDGDGDLDVAVCRFDNVHQKYREAIAEGKDWEEPAGPDLGVGWFENPGHLDSPWMLHVIDNGAAGEHGTLNGTHGIDAGDIDGDGEPDLVGANVGGKSLTWWPIGGERQYIKESGAGGRPHYVAVGDLDGDGRQDVALGNGGGWSVHLQTAEGWEHQTIGSARGGTNVALADIDGDGDLDVIGSAGHGTGVRWFANPSWEEHLIDADLKNVHSLTVGDLDGDSAPDVVANSNGSKQTIVYWNDGSGTFTIDVIDDGNNQQSYGCGLVDIEGDGRMDILLGGRGAKNVVWYRQLD